MASVSAPARRFLRTREAAAYLGFAYRSFKDPGWRGKYKIPHFRLGPSGPMLFSISELDRWVRRHKAGRR